MKTSKSRIQEILQTLGLSEQESAIYLVLIRLGSSPASLIAKEVGVMRQAIYPLLENLIAKEFVEQSDRHGVKSFFVDPSKLTSIFDQRKEQLEEERKALEKEMPHLLSTQQSFGLPAKLQYYQGADGMKRLFNSILDLYKSGAPKEFHGYGINKFREVLGDFIYSWVRKRHEYGVNTKLLIAKGPDDFGITDASNTYGREIKHLNIDEQKAGLYVVDGRVYLFSFDDNVGVMVENQAIAKLMRSVFEDHWKRVTE